VEECAEHGVKVALVRVGLRRRSDASRQGDKSAAWRSRAEKRHAHRRPEFERDRNLGTGAIASFSTMLCDMEGEGHVAIASQAARVDGACRIFAHKRYRRRHTHAPPATLPTFGGRLAVAVPRIPK